VQYPLKNEEKKMLEQTKFKKSVIAGAVAAILSGTAGMSAAQTANDDGGKILEVMVTAQRISQPASKTPLSLSVISGDELKSAGAVNASSLTELVPNVQISNSAGATVIAIRGVSSADNTEKGDPSASFNIDGVNLARPQSAGLAFYDLERVEVLRGPQGTLYGRNSTAGAINLITNKPSNKNEGLAAVEVGNYHSVKFDGMLNSRVNDTLSLRGAFTTSKHDGYLKSTQNFSNNYDDDDSKSGRMHALFKFTPDYSLLLTADASAIKGAGSGQIPLSTFLTKSGEAQRTTTPNIAGKINNKAHGYAAEFKANVGIGEVTYQGAHRILDRDEIGSFGIGGAQPIASTDAKAGYVQSSHEVRLVTSTGPFKTVLGMFWFKEQSHITFNIYDYTPGPGFLSFVQSPTISSSKAVFGETNYSATTDLRLTVGIRHTNDEKSRQGQTRIGDPLIFSSINDATVKYAQTTGKLGADYAISKNIMWYASLSSGYKAGGFNDGTGATNPFLKYDPEHLTSFETGVKGRFLNGSLQLNANVFGYDYKDLQLTALAIDPTTKALSTQTRNAAKASIKGLEIDGKYAVSSQGKINFSLTSLDAKFKNYSPTATAKWDGYSLEKSPDMTLGAGYSHIWNIDSGAAITGNIGAHYSTSYKLNDTGSGVQYTQAAFTKSDISLNYAAPNDRWTVQAYIRNIGNKTVMTDYASISGGVVSLAAPRTIGVRLSSNF
jgi:iron complex outermembrane receptor protein